MVARLISLCETRTGQHSPWKRMEGGRLTVKLHLRHSLLTLAARKAFAMATASFTASSFMETKAKTTVSTPLLLSRNALVCRSVFLCHGRGATTSERRDRPKRARVRRACVAQPRHGKHMMCETRMTLRHPESSFSSTAGSSFDE